MNKKISLLASFFCLPVFLWAAPEDHGRPWDDPGYHESPLGKILLPIAIIVLIIIAIGWVLSNRETMGKILKNGFYIICAGGFLFGIIILPLMERTEKSSVSSHGINEETIPTTNPQPSNNVISNPSYPNNSNNSNNRTPTLKYRTVEYQEKCYPCMGQGKLLCNNCNGTGWISKICSRCNGRGQWELVCTYCRWDGEAVNNGSYECFMCHGTRKYTSSCSYCGGSGREREHCGPFSYYGSDETHYITCTYCNGRGQVTKTRQESYYD